MTKQEVIKLILTDTTNQISMNSVTADNLSQEMDKMYTDILINDAGTKSGDKLVKDIPDNTIVLYDKVNNITQTIKIG